MDTEDSPFEDDLGRTIIKPMPGGRRPRPSTEHELAAFRRSSSEEQAAVPLPRNFINSFNHIIIVHKRLSHSHKHNIA